MKHPSFYADDGYDDYIDAKLHDIRDGGQPCWICGDPSYTIVSGKIYCYKHNPIRRELREKGQVK
jgi:hypothetical protein